MPLVKPHDLKSANSLALEPDKMSSKIQLIIALDLCGYTGNQIAEYTGMTAGRVSIIRNSPLFIQERDAQRERLTSQVLGKQSDKIVSGDPVENRIKDLALQAVEVHENIMSNAKGEMAKIASANSILDRAGYKAKTDKTVVSVEVTEKMSDRFERALRIGNSTIKTTYTKEA